MTWAEDLALCPPVDSYRQDLFPSIIELYKAVDLLKTVVLNNEEEVKNLDVRGMVRDGLDEVVAEFRLEEISMEVGQVLAAKQGRSGERGRQGNTGIQGPPGTPAPDPMEHTFFIEMREQLRDLQDQMEGVLDILDAMPAKY